MMLYDFYFELFVYWYWCLLKLIKIRLFFLVGCYIIYIFKCVLVSDVVYVLLIKIKYCR